MTRNIKQDLANFSRQSVRDLSVSRLEKLYAPIVAQRRAQDEANEREFNLNLPHLERVKKILAQQLEQMANEENAHLPVVSYFDAIQVAKSARVSENDIGCRALITMLENTWKKDRTASISAAKYTALVDHFKKNYPRSAVVDVLEEVGRKGYLSLEVSKLAEIASEIQSQEDYERVILENGLQSNAPHCKKARQFILALVNGEEEDITENEQYNRNFRPYEKPDRDAPPYAEEEEVPHDVKRFQDLHKELREKKQRGDKIGRTAQEENWETQEAYNWLANDEGLYNQAMELAGKWNSGRLFEEEFSDILSGYIENIEEVDWHSVANTFAEGMEDESSDDFDDESEEGEEDLV